MGLTWDCIDFENSRITINEQLQNKIGDGLILSSTKTVSSMRRIKISRTLVDFLKKIKNIQDAQKEYYGEHYYQEYDFVCCRDDGSPINPQTMSSTIKRISDKLDIPFKFHHVRHFHATLLIEADVNLKVVQTRLGHSNISTTLDVYTHLTDRMENEAVERFDNIIK